jgi:leucine dehydrogenase
MQKSPHFEEISVDGYQKVWKITDESVDLKAIICIHNLRLGPALGGTRIYPYASWDAALTDALRLSRGMTYKAAVAQVGLGGGKSVILADAQKKTPALLEAFARAVDQLKGEYICAIDYGCSAQDVLTFHSQTPYVVGIPHPKSSGDPCGFTAWGIYRGIQATLKQIFHSDSVAGKRIAIQGLGGVGMRLAELLFWNGAQLIVTDTDPKKVSQAVQNFGAEAVLPEDIYSVPCDLFSPCALGGILNPMTIPRLQTQAVAGGANNQLLTEEDGEELWRRGILYAPDFVINAGGLINVAEELFPEGYRPEKARARVDQIADQLTQIYAFASQCGLSTQRAAVNLAELRLKYGMGQRTSPVCLHHST